MKSNRRRFAPLLGLLAAPFFARAQAPADAALGTWLTDTQDVKVQVFKCKDKLCGKIVWMKQPNEANGQHKLDPKNPDPQRRGQPILNSVLMRDFAFSGDNVWEDGKIYDARSGKDYSCKMTLVNKNELGVRGFVGFSMLGKTSTWTRVQ